MLKINIWTLIYITLLAGCAPFAPGNYLRSSSIRNPQKINDQWVKPILVPLNAQTLITPLGKKLSEPLMRPKPYKIGAYDSLNIIVWGHPDLSTLPIVPYSNFTSLNNRGGSANPSIIVDANGYIFYPYVGQLRVKELTVNRIQQRITQRISNYIRDPQVTVQVANYRNRNIYVLGEVKKPGAQPLTDKPLTLMAAISNAGDINPNYADPTHIYLIRGQYQSPYIYCLNATTPQSLLIATRVSLEENDIVYISSATITAWGRFLNQILPGMQASVVTSAMV